MARVQVDLRSDTVTRPSPQMRAAMACAEVGDDQYGEDPTVALLEERFAAVVGKQAALFVPSGTMANQIALRVLSRPGDGVVAGERQHIVAWERGAGPRNAGIQFVPVADATGVLDPAAVAAALRSGDHHGPPVSLVAVEDTHMSAGGRMWPAGALAAVAREADAAGVAVHLDGARLWHAAVASGVDVATRAAPATTVTCCLSKGLGAPVGSLLAGPADLMAEAVVERARLGGAMRQAGILAAAGLVAIDTMVQRLADDHRRARRLAEVAAQRWPAAGLDPTTVDTNIVVVDHPHPEAVLAHLAAAGVLAGGLGPGRVRLVTHVDVDDAGVDLACGALASAPR